MTVSIIHRHDTIPQIYRCSVVWQHNIWIITLPILLWISCAGKWPILRTRFKAKEWRTRSNLATGVGVIISYSKASSSARVFSFVGWTTSFFATTLATNVICTCTSFSAFQTDPPHLPLLTFIRVQLWSRSGSGLSIGPIRSIVKRRARSGPC